MQAPDPSLDPNFVLPSPSYAISETPSGRQHKISYTQYGNANDFSKLIVTVHGLTGDAANFHYFSEYALKRGYCVVNIEMAGRGFSDDLLLPTDYTYMQYITDIVAVCNQVYIQLSPERQAQTQWYWLGTSMGGILGILLCGGLLERYNFLPKRFQAICLNDIGPQVSINEVDRICGYVSVPTYFPTKEDAVEYYWNIYRSGFGPYVDRTFFLHRAIMSLKFDEEKQQYTSRYDRMGLLNGIKDLTLPGLEIIYAGDNNNSKPQYLNQQLISIDEIEPFLSNGAHLEYSFWPFFKQMTLPMLLYHGKKSTLLSENLVNDMAHCYKTINQQQFEYKGWENTGHVPPLYVEDEFIPLLDFFDKY